MKKDFDEKALLGLYTDYDNNIRPYFNKPFEVDGAVVATDYKQGCSPQAMTRKDNKTRTDTLRNLPSMTGNHSLQTGGETSQLNPLFVEDMMGFPLGWTTLPFLGQNGGRKA